MGQRRLAVDLDERLAERLEAAAAKAKMTVEAFVTEAVARTVADLEPWAEDEAACADYERIGEAIPFDAVQSWVESWWTPTNC